MKQVISTLTAIILMLTGCGGVRGGLAGGGSQAEPSRAALSEPVYPEFPQQPQFPTEGGMEAWQAYNDAYEKYTDALRAIQGEGMTESDRAALTAFTAKSTPLALAGREGENAIYSPLSLWSAMALLAQCAGGDSRQQVLDALGMAGIDQLPETVSRTWRALYTDDGISSLILGSSVWLNSALDGTYVQETLDTLAQKYYAGVYAVPMGTGEADAAVTEWVKKQTNGLIGGGQPVVRTERDTLALLASSLYYKAAWVEEFSAGRTEEDVFTDAAGKESRVDFMHRTERASFLRRDGWQAARLSTKLGEMVFVLPDEGVTPESLLNDPGFLASLDIRGEGSTRGEVRWSVPKFDVSSDLNLNETLKAMGVTDLLDKNKADLSALTDLDAFLSDAKQLARVKVDEEGVEAAAVTMMMLDATAMPEPDPEICVMDLDRPFLFVIRVEDVPLFVGVVNQVQA